MYIPTHLLETGFIYQPSGKVYQIKPLKFSREAIKQTTKGKAYNSTSYYMSSGNKKKHQHKPLPPLRHRALLLHSIPACSIIST